MDHESQQKKQDTFKEYLDCAFLKDGVSTDKAIELLAQLLIRYSEEHHAESTRES